MQYATAAIGMSIPRIADAQIRSAKAINQTSAKPGDLVAYTNPGASAAHHIAMVAGSGTMIEAPHTGANVRYASMQRSGQVMQFGRLPGLAKGGVSLRDGYAKIHQGETVLTARLSEGLKKGIEGMQPNTGTISGYDEPSMMVNEGDNHVNINVYAAPGMDVDALADAIEARQARAGLRVGVGG